MNANAAATELNVEDFPALITYLRTRGAISQQEMPMLSNLEGGVSNRVVLVKPPTRAPFVVKQALPKLRVQVDWFCTPERITREALALSHLSELVRPGSVPRLLFHDPAAHLLAMEQVPEPHHNWKHLLLTGEVVDSHFEQFGALLGAIHRESAGKKDELQGIFGSRDVFETLRLEPYYRYTATQVPDAAPFLNTLIAETLATQTTLVHGDYSPKNILVHAGRLVLLDCEVVHFGDPAFDLGFSMAHFLGKANHLRHRRVRLPRRARLQEAYVKHDHPEGPRADGLQGAYDWPWFPWSSVHNLTRAGL